MNQKRTIKRESLDKALSDTKRRSFKNSTIPPKSGSWKNEHSFKSAISTNPNQADKIFIIGIEDVYDNRSLVDKNWVVYAYDMNGEFIEKTHGSKLGGKFFMELTYLQ